MKKTLLLLVVFLSIGQVFAQNKNIWKSKDVSEISDIRRARPNNVCEGELYFTLNLNEFRQSLLNVKDKFSNAPGVAVTIPNLNGDLETFLVWENSNFVPELQTRFPEIRSYVGKGVTDKYATINFSVSPQGIQTMVFRANNGAEFLEGYDKEATTYVLYNSKNRISGKLPFNCSTTDVNLSNEVSEKYANTTLADNAKYKTFLLALSCTAEYANYFGATSSADVALVLAGMNATMTRVNGVMEKDLSVHLNIINNTDLIIFYNAATDPYSNASVGTAQANANNANGWNIQVQNTITNIIGNGAYNIGHLFGASGGGGNAGCIGCVCVDDTTSTTDKNKGSGYTSPSDGIPAGDSFDIDFVVHEMGHQLGANHTFTYNYEGSGVQVEPGSGTSIMAYAGVATSDALGGAPAYNVQPHSDPLFCFRSIFQIQTNLNLSAANCAVTTALAGINATPTANGGADRVIPIGTAFKLTGTATDADAGDVLTYSWEQNNGGTASTTQDDSRVLGTKTIGPNFRIFPPSASPSRYFPELSKILAGNLVVTTASDAVWESCSSVARSLSFTFTARDNHPGMGQTKTDSSVIVTVNATAGPFVVTSQNTTGINWPQGSSQTITWNVANTTALAGSANVNIKLSTDGGLNFDTFLATDTPNDGTETITVPNLSALNCRILIEPTANVYLAVNSKPFSIGATCNSYSISPNAAIADGSGTSTAGATTTSILNVPDNVTISNLKVNLKINHTKIGDLVVKILHPDGTTRTLWNRSCNSGTYSGIDIIFADGTGAISCASPAIGTHNAAQSSSALGGYNGKSSQGNWTLTVTDNSATNTGTLVSWGLDFGCTLANSTYEISDLTIYPNPNKGNFNIQFNNTNSSEIKVNVFDISGRKIFENNYTSQATFNENIQLNNAQAGVYLVNVSDGNRKVVKRIVIE
jgi:subtilisin-like proprotein convertase family protein